MHGSGFCAVREREMRARLPGGWLPTRAPHAAASPSYARTTPPDYALVLLPAYAPALLPAYAPALLPVYVPALPPAYVAVAPPQLTRRYGVRRALANGSSVPAADLRAAARHYRRAPVGP